jgi:hypothetical protein
MELCAVGIWTIFRSRHVRRARVVRDLADHAQASLTLLKASAKSKRVSRPAAPLGFRYEQSGQYVEPGTMRKSWLHSMELAQAAEESRLHVEQKDCADLPTEEYQVNVNLRQKRFLPRKRSATIAMMRLRKTCTRSQRSARSGFQTSTLRTSLRGIATPAQLQWPKRSKKELLMGFMNRSSTGLLDSNKVKSREHFKANGWTNLIAAREARAARDKEQIAKAIALVDEHEKKHGTLTPAHVIEKRKAKDEADLANGMSQDDID